ncbi:hypothetical protein RR46_08791 [Papilio xuthus]|uniref:Uncharacterized protein n=1 Tax=Papilio xuthus TaxID=66420 RepID=A0A194PPU1_PAPXU|nr:hypothetical protein RR46_08791 [Papilio xuthus]
MASEKRGHFPRARETKESRRRPRRGGGSGSGVGGDGCGLRLRRASATTGSGGLKGKMRLALAAPTHFAFSCCRELCPIPRFDAIPNDVLQLCTL